MFGEPSAEGGRATGSGIFGKPGSSKIATASNATDKYANCRGRPTWRVDSPTGFTQLGESAPSRTLNTSLVKNMQSGIHNNNRFVGYRSVF
jgi:hypothetical protein